MLDKELTMSGDRRVLILDKRIDDFLYVGVLWKDLLS